MLLLFILILCLAIVLSLLTTVPIIVAVILCFTVFSKDPRVFIAAILGGLFIDYLYLRTQGSTSLFLVIFTFMIFLYQRKFEIQTASFVWFASFIGAILYLRIFGYNQILIQSLIASFLALFLFKFLNRFSNMNHEL